MIGPIPDDPVPRFATCPFLPMPDGEMDWRSLNELRGGADARLYVRCLAYSQLLWRRGLAARALLAADRALFYEVASEDPATEGHPLPYRAIAWIVAHTPPRVFIGNPRIHYQHLADRVRGARALQRRWRAWACWSLVRLARPELPPDPKHAVLEPSMDAIAQALVQHGVSNELPWWRQACDDARAYQAQPPTRTGP
ncbi:MAG TPA: hypothetical protein VGA56_15920 [Opitutaceae bacterium]